MFHIECRLEAAARTDRRKSVWACKKYKSAHPRPRSPQRVHSNEQKKCCAYSAYVGRKKTDIWMAVVVVFTPAFLWGVICYQKKGVMTVFEDKTKSCYWLNICVCCEVLLCAMSVAKTFYHDSSFLHLTIYWGWEILQARNVNRRRICWRV